MEPWVQIDSPKGNRGDAAGAADAANLPELPEGYLQCPNGYWNWYDWNCGRGGQEAIVVRADAGKDVSGRLFVPDKDWKRMVEFKFTVPSKAAADAARDPFYQAKLGHYRLLLSRGVPGAAWFRHQAAEAAAALGKKADEVQAVAGPGQNGVRSDNLESTYNLFTGGRALSENLQLDRVMPNRTRPGDEEKETVPLDSVPGLTVKEMDWKEKIKDKKPQLDPLAALIPIDQHAVFFPSFQAMTAVADAADSEGVPVLQFAEPRAEDAADQGEVPEAALPLAHRRRPVAGATGDQRRSVHRLRPVPAHRLGRGPAAGAEGRGSPGQAAGPLVGPGVAQQPAQPRGQASRGDGAGRGVFGARSPDRSVCVYVAQVGPAMVVTNSLVQLERLIDTQEGKQASLASAPEYAFFRDRYPRADAEKGEESALAVLTDATIRRWCGPRWRIADSRRTCAAAVLSELQAERMSDFVKGDVEKTVLHTDRPLPGAGEIRLTPAGVTSGTYGSLDFLTPIVELPMEKVTQAEANTYNTWRNGYQSNWSNFFDPVALRLAVKAGKISADVTVMPLIVSSEYRQYVDMTSGVKLASGAGDPHDALLHLAVALNHDAGPVKDIGDFFKRWDDGRAKVKLDPLGWVGESAAIYVDDDEAFWAEAAKADDFQKFLRPTSTGCPSRCGSRTRTASNWRPS